MIAPLSEDEDARLDNLRQYGILDTLPQQEYDDLTALAAEICGTPVSLISLVDQDRQWFKSALGFRPEQTETSRDLAFCAHNIIEPNQTMVVPDARLDPRFKDNALVHDDPNVIFYAGVPLVSPEGHALGSLCVIDRKPRELSAHQLDLLLRLGRQAEKLLELHRSLQTTRHLLHVRDEANAQLRDFSHVIAHDLKAPIRNISQATHLLREDYSDRLGDDGQELLDLVAQSTTDATYMIEGVLQYSQATRALLQARERISMINTVERATRQLALHAPHSVSYIGTVTHVSTSPIALLQIFQNLIGNALKFSDKPACRITVDCVVRAAGGHTVSVHDDGPGIPPEQQEAVFRLFHSSDRGSKRSHGVGLSIVRRLVTSLGGTIRLSSGPGEGTTFTFDLPA
ncbi:Adaptive-response sensory-kinase SasA [Neolewinella maritima]|uniref:histidine kinase n=1 Tax=Neolewinella maritima TaxID=1383882 RepID=A0ABM9AX90_9BACT|nr:GAF domain-containing sensor histidine kinase [Neolewinella maritima]CAH0999147.1 Adaptive-response sensory-kinase SasA [Neolewinella maritima]